MRSRITKILLGSLILLAVAAGIYLLISSRREKWPRKNFFVVARIESMDFSDDSTRKLTDALRRALNVALDTTHPLVPFFYRRIKGRDEIAELIEKHGPLLLWWIWASPDSVRLMAFPGFKPKPDTLLLPDTLIFVYHGEFDALTIANAVAGVGYFEHYLQNGDVRAIDAAVPRLEDAAVDFNSKQLWLLLGWSYMAQGRYDFARSVIRRSDTSDYRTLYALATAMLRDGEYDSAMIGFQRTIEKAPPDCVMPLFGYGEALIKLEIASEAVSPLKAGLKKMPDYPRGNFLLGLAYDVNENPDSAAVYYLKAAELDSLWTTPLYNLAVLKAKVGDTTGAIAFYRKVLSRDTTAIDAMKNLAWLYLESAKPDLAARWFERIIEMDSLSTDGFYGLGMAFFESGKVEQADSLLRLCISRAPEFLPAYLARVKLALKLGDMGKALDAAHETMDSLPDEPLAYNALASVYIASGDYRSGVRLLKQALELNPSEADILANLALAYHMLDDFQNAEKYYRKALEITSSPALAVNLASLYIEMKRPREALSVLKKVARNDARAMYLRGVAYYLLGNIGMARLSFVRCENSTDDVQLKTMAHRHLLDLSEYKTL